MNRNERIFTKKDIIIFFIISTLCSIHFVFAFCDKDTLIDDIIRVSLDSTIFFIPPVFAVILNLIFKLANIEDEKIIKITKIIFYPIVYLLMFVEGALIVLFAPK